MLKTYRPIIRLFIGSDYSNISRFLIIVLVSVICGGFEGASYAFLLMGFSSIAGHAEIQWLTQSWIQAWVPSSDFGVFVFFILIGVGLQAVRSALVYLGTYMASQLGLKIQSGVQYQVYHQILRFSFSYANQYKVGDLVEYARAPASFIPQILNGINLFIVNSCLCIMTLAGMCWISVKMTLCTGLILGSFVFAQKLILRKIMKASMEFSNHMAELAKQTVQSLEGLRLIHTYNEQKTTLRKVSDLLKQMVSSTGMLNLWVNSIPCINELVGIFSIGSILLIGLVVFEGTSAASIPLLFSFILLTYRLSTRLQAAVGVVSTIASSYGYILRLNHILSDEGKEFYPQGGIPFHSLQQAIEFKHVYLTYPSSHNPSLRDISLTIPQGSITALVGGSGGGKSSLVDLLIRLYEPTRGQIQVDGRDLTAYEIGSWRKMIGVVSQDTFIFSATIEENIRFGYEKASFEQVQKAAELAGAHEFIARLPAQYQSLVGERGYKLSGGERQRLALARALLRDPQILILDEATSHLDSHSEKLILNALENYCKHRTVLVVAHRLSTIAKADKIVVIERGQIVETGTHEELLLMNQKYAYFWKIQSHQLKSQDLAEPSLAHKTSLF